MDYIHDMGLLLLRNTLMSRLEHLDPNSKFPFKQFKYLMKFCVDHDSCVFVNKLLRHSFSGIVDARGLPFSKFALQEIASFTEWANLSMKQIKKQAKIIIAYCSCYDECRQGQAIYSLPYRGYNFVLPKGL
ncbi:Hypothetical predicted protein [Olea europaea subsp. europaea]|uniref:Uncharacterized protein n=1 Tax=Olea europaea subsp. europaea TaxID=158383 RepID=A0A8S0SVL2_OLEEU|nr:Hypothetical predicted protein [Olea europaea subsp. europaea]